MNRIQSNYRKLFFASDFHLGYNDLNNDRENSIINWINNIPDNSELFLVGDIFDFWIEYKNLIPNKNTNFLRSLDMALSKGIKIYLFKGNHDMWISDFFSKKGIRIIDNELIIKNDNYTFYVHHGDGILEGEYAYRLLKSILRSPLTQKIAKNIHPDLLFKITHKWSQHGHNKKIQSSNPPITKLLAFANNILQHRHIDYFIFGHYHYKAQININSKSQIILLGDWLEQPSWATFDTSKLILN